MNVKIKLNGGIMPKKATTGAAGFDVYVPEDVMFHRSGRHLLDLKFSIDLPHGYAATIQPRSGFSAKGMVAMVTNYYDGKAVTSEQRIDADVIRGLIDEDYRGTIKVILYIRSNHHDIVFKKGTRIAQMQILKVPQVELIETDKLSESDRGEKGIGSTGVR